MANNKQDYVELCIKCGKEVRQVMYVGRSKETGNKGIHYECTACGYLSTVRIVEEK